MRLWLTISFLLLPAIAAAQGYQQPTWSINQATCAVAVTPSDSADLPAGPAPCNNAFPPKAVFTAGTGGGAACVLVMALYGDQAQVTYSNVQPGAFLPVRPKRIYATSTTCTGIVALY